ncbi:MAG: hypothetical protein J6Q51_01405, partial [Clostridia bacterium]|nr:hypothetical protein [Clostridia bacterium]
FVKIDNNLKDGSVYKTENESFLESLLVVIDFYGYYGGNILPYGKPAMVHQGQITKAMVASFASQSLAHIKKTTVGETDYYYAIEGNNNYLEVREIYFDALGLSNVSGATKTNSISKTQVYQTVSIDHDNNTGTPNKNYYSINDNSKIESTDGEKTVYKTVCDEYKLLYADGSLQAEAEQDITDEEIQKNINSNYTITKLTMSSGIFDLDGEDGEVWKEIDGDMVLDNVENEKADLAEFLSGKSGSDKKYVSKVNLSDYTNGVVAFDIYDVAGYNLMREIINSNGSYLDTRENEVVLYPEAVDNYNKLVKMFKGEEGYFFSSFKINIKADIYGVSAQLGTKDIPFVGEIVGSGSKAPKLSGVKNAVSSNYSGLVVFAKDLTIKNLDIQYSDLNYALTEDESRPVYHVAGLVGNLVKDGNLTLQDIKLTYNFKDYYEDMDNDISSLNPIAVGGLVGFADTNSKITLKDNIVINSFNVDLKSEGKTTALYGKGSVEATYDQDGAQTSYIKAVGAYVGSMRNANFEVSNEIKSPLSIDNININVNSTNTIVGGLIGYAGIETYIDDGEHPGSGTISLVNIKMGDSESDRIINVSADASKLPTGSRTVSVGGLIGKINGEYSVGLDKLYINLKQIAANTSKAGTEVVYVGGLFGEVTNLEKIVGLDKAESGDESIELGNPRDMKERLYITAGIGGNEYPEKAYANLFVGNKVVDEARNVVYNAKCYSKRYSKNTWW